VSNECEVNKVSLKRNFKNRKQYVERCNVANLNRSKGHKRFPELSNKLFKAIVGVLAKGAQLEKQSR